MTIKNFSPYKIVKQAFSELKPNEQKVISGRFGIDEPRRTLSSIGKELNLSRERIRQIEKDALKKLSAFIVGKENAYVAEILDAFEKSGGVSSHERIAEKFLEDIYRKNNNEYNSLNLIFTLIPQIKKIEKTRELESSWILSSITKEDLIGVVDDWIKHLSSTKKPETIDVLLKAHPNHNKYQITFLSELPLISKKIVKTETGHIGLSSWPEVNPRNVRDKIYYILKREGKPLHFNLIAEKINEQNFGNKKVVRATVHNELIADDRFVLVGRGIYALKEWGYEEGTVKDIIIDILSRQGIECLTSEEIIKEVLKQRTVKKNTILINLQTKPEFKKVKKDCYALSK